jgi:hypothetical protein
LAGAIDMTPVTSGKRRAEKEVTATFFSFSSVISGP